MEGHFCQCDGKKKDPLSHYEKLSQNNENISQNNDFILQHNEKPSQN